MLSTMLKLACESGDFLLVSFDKDGRLTLSIDDVDGSAVPTVLLSPIEADELRAFLVRGDRPKKSS